MQLRLPRSGLVGRIDRVVKAWIRQHRRNEARRNQERFVGRYIAVTGSCGKTTTTALTSALLGCYGTSATGGRYNSGIKLLRTMRHLRTPFDFFVQETSGHMPGALDLSVGTFRIDAAVITSIGFDHATNFRVPGMEVPDAVAQEKGRLVEAVASGGFACLNFDDPRVRAMATRTTQRVIGFGVAADADLRAINVAARWPHRLSFDLVVAGRTYPVATRFVGTLMLTNILGALAVVHGMGLPLEPAIARLAVEEPVDDRMGVHAGRDGKTYILDAIKAPFWSVEQLAADLPRMAIPALTMVIGDMSDIRGNSSKQYRKLLRQIAPEVGTLVISGRAAEYGARMGSEIDNLVVAPTAFDVAAYLDTLPPGVVYLKGSKTSQLWRVLDQVSPMNEMAGT